MKLPFWIIPILVLISGCGQVAVFGHTVGEQATPKSQATSTAVPVVPSAQEVPAATGKALETKASKNVAPSVQIVKSVTLTLTPQIAAQVADDARFNKDALLGEIKSELQARKLLDAGDARASAVEIILDDYSMRPTSNAIVFGNVISAGTLSGAVRLSDEPSGDLPYRRIEAKSQVSIPANGESKAPLAALYRQFAVVMADILTSTPPKPIIGADQHPRS